MKSRMQAALCGVFLILLSAASIAGVIDDIQKRGTLRVGVAEFVPWTFRNPQGNLEGHEIDIGRQIAHDMGVEPDFKVYDLEGLFGALDRGDIDVIAAGLAITPSRALHIEYSTPYFESGTTLVVNTQAAAGVTDVESLNREGRVVVTVEDSYSAEIAPLLFDDASIMPVETEAEAEKALVTGKAQGSVVNLAEAQYLVAKHPDILAMPLDEPLLRSVAGFGVKRDNQALLNFLNAWIAARTADNWLSSTYDHWFGGYDWIAIVPGE